MITIRRTAIFVALAGIAMFGLWYSLAPTFKPNTPMTASATVVKSSAGLKGFNLTDTNGKKFTAQSLRGHWTLLFFGYMTCPDICPTTLGIVRDAWSTFPNQQSPARFVFVNISPAPADDQGLRAFITNYNSSFIGVTGTTTELTKLGDQLGIFTKQQDNRIDHTASLMLIDPQGRLRAVFTPPFSAPEVAADLQVLTKG